MNQDISIERLRTMLSYDAKDGSLRWAERRSATAAKGSLAGFINHKGYRMVGIDGKQYRAHRIILAMAAGQWPSDDLVVDHIDGNRDNNRIENLRLCTHSENQHNRDIPSNNSTGLLGVSYDKADRNWRASICVGRKRSRIGNYATPEEAHQAYLDAKAKLHPIQPVPRRAKSND